MSKSVHRYLTGKIIASTGEFTQQVLRLLRHKIIVPASNFTESQSPQMMARATIVLGIMGCDQPHTLNPRYGYAAACNANAGIDTNKKSGHSVRKNVALSLALMLSDSELDEKVPGNEHLATSSTSIARTLASMELLSQGFTTWEAYINAAEILRTMFLYASEPQPVLIRGAKNAIFLIAKSNITLVVGTLAYDTAHSKNTEERIRCLKLLGWLVRKVRWSQNITSTILLTLVCRIQYFYSPMSTGSSKLLSRRLTRIFLISEIMCYLQLRVCSTTW